jgi:hypothetical protein
VRLVFNAIPFSDATGVVRGPACAPAIVRSPNSTGGHAARLAGVTTRARAGGSASARVSARRRDLRLSRLPAARTDSVPAAAVARRVTRLCRGPRPGRGRRWGWGASGLRTPFARRSGRAKVRACASVSAWTQLALSTVFTARHARAGSRLPNRAHGARNALVAAVAPPRAPPVSAAQLCRAYCMCAEHDAMKCVVPRRRR